MPADADLRARNSRRGAGMRCSSCCAGGGDGAGRGGPKTESQAPGRAPPPPFLSQGEETPNESSRIRSRRGDGGGGGGLGGGAPEDGVEGLGRDVEGLVQVRHRLLARAPMAGAARAPLSLSSWLRRWISLICARRDVWAETGRRGSDFCAVVVLLSRWPVAESGRAPEPR